MPSKTILGGVLNPNNPIKTNRQINNYEFENANYDVADIKQYLRTGLIPANMSNYQIRKFHKQFSEFDLLNNRTLAYNNKLYVETQNVQARLLTLYNDEESGFGRGLNGFFKYVESMYLGISRAVTRDFLKAQQSYQLTKQIQRTKVSVKKSSEENGIHYMDLIDYNRDLAGNLGYRYILSLLDSYSRKIVLFRLKNKSDAFHELSNHYMAINEFPKILASDRGGEFRNTEFRNFANQYGFKLKYSDSYSPIVSIENVNKQIRVLISKFFVKNRNKIWATKLDTIERNINNWIDVSFEPDPNPQRKGGYLVVGQVGDRCRIKTSVLSSDIRKLNKTHEQKHVHIKWSIAIYTVMRVILNRQMVGALPKYELVTGNLHLQNEDGSTHFIKHSDIQWIDRSENNFLIQEDESRINDVSELVSYDIDETPPKVPKKVSSKRGKAKPVEKLDPKFIRETRSARKKNL